MKLTLPLTLLAASLALAGDTTIVQKDREFSQTTLSIKPGDSVTFRNGDTVTHNVFSNTPGLEFDIRRQAPGGSSTVPFPKEGEVEVRCSIHPKMKLMISVKK